MDKGTKLAIGFGVGLTLFSLTLIAIGDVVSYFAGLFGDSAGVSAGSSLAGMGDLIIYAMIAIVVVVVGVWVYSKLHQDSYRDGMF